MVTIVAAGLVGPTVLVVEEAREVLGGIETEDHEMEVRPLVVHLLVLQTAAPPITREVIKGVGMEIAHHRRVLAPEIATGVHLQDPAVVVAKVTTVVAAAAGTVTLGEEDVEM